MYYNEAETPKSELRFRRHTPITRSVFFVYEGITLQGFFSIKNVATIGGVILSFVLPHIFFEDDHYIEVIETEDDPIVEPEITEPQSAEEQ